MLANGRGVACVYQEHGWTCFAQEHGWTCFAFDGMGAGKSGGDSVRGLNQQRLDLGSGNCVRC